MPVIARIRVYKDIAMNRENQPIDHDEGGNKTDFATAANFSYTTCSYQSPSVLVAVLRGSPILKFHGEQ